MLKTDRQRMYGGILGVLSAANDRTQFWPANDPEFLGAAWVEFVFYLTSITGSPTNAKLQAKFRKAAADTGGNEWSAPNWQDFDDDDVALRCLGGKHWGSLAAGRTQYARATDHNLGTLHDSTLDSGGQTLGYHVSCRVVAPLDKMCVQLIPTFTGGTAPTYQVSGYYVIGYD